MGLVLVAMGGNLGEVHNCFTQARTDISALEKTCLSGSSMLYYSPPLGPANQADYLNTTILLKTKLTPPDLLRHLKKIEIKHGRIRTERWGPRTLDLDLVMYDHLILDTDTLTLPHPHMHKRIFVLQPMCELLPDWIHPRLGMTASAILNALVEKGERLLTQGTSW
ncbi:MAG: 2-amino-4-hydroxy-6-hydroxymethyldihydropteridine diphosphokinase [Mariprofundaceae bacterium]